MFTTTLLVLMAVSIAVLVVLVIYLVDRFNGLERETQQVLRSLNEQQAQAKPAGPYAGLSGKALWDALAGDGESQIDEATLDAVRKRYRLILGEHIGFIFNEGAADQRRGLDSAPGSTRVVRTPKTQLESWLPAEAVADIYRCGQGYAAGDAAQLPALRQRLDEVCAGLHERVRLDVLQPASSILMPPQADAMATSGAAGAAQTTP